MALRAQHAASGYDKATISVLRESQIDMPMEEADDYVPSPLPMELAQPPEAGTDYEPARNHDKTSQTNSSTTHSSHVSETIRSKSLAPGLPPTWTTSHSFLRGNAPS